MNTEHKQSINLTSYAESILKEDLELFAPDQTATGFLNDIIERYCDIADASIHTAIVRQRARLSHALDQDLSLSAELTDGQKEKTETMNISLMMALLTGQMQIITTDIFPVI